MSQIKLSSQSKVTDAEISDQVKNLINQQLNLIPFSPIEKIENAGLHIGTDCCNAHYLSIHSVIRCRKFNAFERKINGESEADYPIKGSNDELWMDNGENSGHFEVEIPESFHYVTCGNCGGRGKVRCGKCGGSGKVTEHHYEDVKGRCSFCNGTGIKDGKDCPECNGRGEKYESREVSREVTCPRCNGSGKVTCDSCGGCGQRLRGLKLMQIELEDFRILNAIPEKLHGIVPVLGTVDGTEDLNVDIQTMLNATVDKETAKKLEKNRPKDDSVLGPTNMLAEFDLTQLEDVEEDLPNIFDTNYDNAQVLYKKMCGILSEMNGECSRTTSFICHLHEKNYYRYIFTPDHVEGIKDKDQELILYASLQDKEMYAEDALRTLASGEMEKAANLLLKGKTEESLHSALVGYYKSGKNADFRKFVTGKIIGWTGVLYSLITLLSFAGSWYYWYYMPKGKSLGDLGSILVSDTHLLTVIVCAIIALLAGRLLCFNLSWKLKTGKKYLNLQVRNLIFSVLAGFAGMLMCKLCEWMIIYLPNFTFTFKLPKLIRGWSGISCSVLHLLPVILIVYLIAAGWLSPTLRKILGMKLPVDVKKGARKVKAIERKVLNFTAPLKTMNFIILVDIPIVIAIAATVVFLVLI